MVPNIAVSVVDRRRATVIVPVSADYALRLFNGSAGTVATGVAGAGGRFPCRVARPGRGARGGYRGGEGHRDRRDPGERGGGGGADCDRAEFGLSDCSARWS